MFIYDMKVTSWRNI